MFSGAIDTVGFTITGTMFPQNRALTTSIVEGTLCTATAASPYIGAVLYEVGTPVNKFRF